jgi:hypothetical protein
MSHPCDGHACDHCYLCDVVGVCCATVPHPASSSVATADDQLHNALVREACSCSSLGDLINQGGNTRRALPPSSGLQLATGQPPAADFLALLTPPRLEAEHVLAPRCHQQ